MRLEDQVDRRLALAEQIGAQPVRWIATASVVEQLSDEIGQLAGLPIEVGTPRSEWGLELVLASA